MLLEDEMKQVLNGQWSVASGFKMLLFLLLFTVFTGCALKEEAIKPASGYFDILNHMTRSKKVIDNMDNKLFIYATYNSWPLREAYVDEYAGRYLMYNYQKDRLKVTEKEYDERFNEFFIAVYTPEEHWNDLNTPESIWKIYLEDEKGDRVTPVDIKKVDVNSPLIREFYPFLDLWSSGYVIRFPKHMTVGTKPVLEKDAKYFKLIITGVVGSAMLEWELR